MRIRDKIDKKKVSHYLFNDEEIVCMNKKYFNNNYINKDKIREKIEEEEEHLDFENTEMEDHTIAILNELLEGR